MAEKSQGERQWAAGRSGRDTDSGKRHPQGTSVKGPLAPRGHSVLCFKIILRTLLLLLEKKGKN